MHVLLDAHCRHVPKPRDTARPEWLHQNQPASGVLVAPECKRCTTGWPSSTTVHVLDTCLLWRKQYLPSLGSIVATYPSTSWLSVTHGRKIGKGTRSLQIQNQGKALRRVAASIRKNAGGITEAVASTSDGSALCTVQPE
jgi:hypothetical protein